MLNSHKNQMHQECAIGDRDRRLPIVGQFLAIFSTKTFTKLKKRKSNFL